jgi:hypothetical protein
VTNGCRAVEPAAVMLPVTQLIVGAGMAVAGAEVPGLTAGAGLGVELADEHAESTTVAATASALMRRIPFSNSISPHWLGDRRG